MGIIFPDCKDNKTKQGKFSPNFAGRGDYQSPALRMDGGITDSHVDLTGLLGMTGMKLVLSLQGFGTTETRLAFVIAVAIRSFYCFSSRLSLEFAPIQLQVNHLAYRNVPFPLERTPYLC